MSENQKDPQYKLRWSEELRDKVATSAKAYNRSMNADIIARLERSFLTEPDFSPLNMPPEELVERLKEAKFNHLNDETSELVLEIKSKEDLEKDKKIQKLEEQLANSMKMMEMITGMFESMLNGNQEEYMEKVFKQYPNVKKFYNKSLEDSKKIIEDNESDEDHPLKGSW